MKPGYYWVNWRNRMISEERFIVEVCQGYPANTVMRVGTPDLHYVKDFVNYVPVSKEEVPTSTIDNRM